MASKMDKLKQSAGGNLDRFFSAASEGVSEGLNKKPVNDKGDKPERAEKPQKPQKKVFSFRAEAEDADNWRLWADAKGLKVDELGSKAISEYVKRHPLTADQKQIYELKKAQKKM